MTLLSESWNPQHRVRKSAGAGVPDKLSFAIPFRGDNIVLNLERSRLLPTVTSDEVTTRAANEFSEVSCIFFIFPLPLLKKKKKQLFYSSLHAQFRLPLLFKHCFSRVLEWHKMSRDIIARITCRSFTSLVTRSPCFQSVTVYIKKSTSVNKHVLLLPFF